MKKFIKAEFENIDMAEKAAIAVNKKMPFIKGIHIYPLHPESVQLTQSHAERFTLLPTAVASMNYITALVETDYNFEDISEESQRQTSFVEFTCDDNVSFEAEQILIQMGGSTSVTS